jgi:hypothetical protein
MPRADAYIAGRFAHNANKNTVRGKSLSQLEVTSLISGLRADAADFYYSGWISFLDALSGISKGFYTWSVVKLYYSVFYSLRASLAIDNVCAFHVNGSPFSVVAQPGQNPMSSTDRGTHKTVLKTFERNNPNHPLVSQQIDLEDPVDWIVAKRESANYGDPRFSEPDSRDELEYVAAHGLRKVLAGYVAEPSLLYVFDPEHAMIAYPLRALQLIGDQVLAVSPLVPSEAEKLFLRRHCKDNSGLYSFIVAELERFGLLD